MILAFYHHIGEQEEEFISSVEGFAVLKGNASKIVAMISKQGLSSYSGSFQINGMDLFLDDLNLAKVIKVAPEGVFPDFSMPEGIDFSSLFPGLTSYKEQMSLSDSDYESVVKLIETIYAALKSHPSYVFLDCRDAPIVLHDALINLASKLFASAPVLVYFGSEEGEPHLEKVGQNAEKEKPIESPFASFIYDEPAASNAGFDFFVEDYVGYKDFVPGKMFDAIAEAKHKKESEIEKDKIFEKKEGKRLSEFGKSFALNVSFAILFVLFDLLTGIIFWYLSKDQDESSTISNIFLFLGPLFALIGLVPVVFFYGDYPYANPFKKRSCWVGLFLIGLCSMEFAGVLYLLWKKQDWFAVSSRLPFLVSLAIFPVLEAAAVYAYYFFKKRKKKEK